MRKRNKQTLCKATRARNLGWNDSFEIGEIEISNLDSTALSKLTGSKALKTSQHVVFGFLN